MVWIPGGEFSMGSDASGDALCGLPGVTRDAQPIHRVYVNGFWMDKTDVTNEKFEEFVKATGYVTIAERTPTKEEFPTAPPENLVAGSVVFTPTTGPVPLTDHYQWWNYVKGANWRHPEGPQSSIKGREKYPVVQVAYPDAVAYGKVGRQAVADGGGVGVCRSRRASGKNLLVGRRIHAWRQAYGKHVPRAIPCEGHWRGRLRWDRTGREVSAERLRFVRHGRERVAMVQRLVPA
jgi:hypothetical protein